MSKYLAEELQKLAPYTPGEQPKGGEYVKLNTNESPYFPSRYAVSRVTEKALDELRLYSDPESAALRDAIAKHYRLKRENVAVGNGSDEVLAMCFPAFFAGQPPQLIKPTISISSSTPSKEPLRSFIALKSAVPGQ